ncbi:MAG: hypothetical protein RIK87_05795 [Fuerstiella sp.]
MTDEKIHVELVRTGELRDFVNRPDVMQGSVVPISRLRAAAHAANPVADPDDPALMLAMRDGKCLAYLGFMPGLLRIDGQLQKIFWYTTWYAAKDPRDAAAGGVLLLASLRVGVDIATTGLDPKTFEYYRRLRFKAIGPLPYFELNFDRFDPLGFPARVLQVLLRRKGRRSAAVDAIFRAGRGFTKTAAYGLARNVLRHANQQYDFAELSELPADAWSDEEAAPVEFYRDTEFVRWSLQYPWITDQKDLSTPRYEFSDFRELVRFVVLEARRRNSNEHLGHVVLSVCRDQGITTIKILHHFLHCSDRYQVLLAAALVYSGKFRADRIHVPAGCEDSIGSSVLLRTAFRRRNREYFCFPRRRESVLGPALDRLELNYCDGDTPFS